MNDLDDIARGAVAQLKATAAHVARTEEGLAALRPTAPTRRRPMILSLAAATVLLGAGVWYASRGTHDKSIGPATTVEQVETTAVPTTTTPATTTPVTTVSALPVSSIVLRSDGVGDARFGMSIEEAMPILRAAFGVSSVDVPLTNAVTEPTPRSSLAGTAVSPIDTFWDEWVYPASRRMCWDSATSIGWCVSFAGDDSNSLTLVGWDYFPAGGTGRVHLTDSNGLTLGTSWAEARPYLSAPTHGCYIQAEAVTDNGVLVELSLPPGAPVDFGSDCENSRPMTGPSLPDPAAVTISGMRAGRMAGSPPGD